MQVRTLLVASGVPLQRSPIGFCSTAVIECRSPVLRSAWFAQPPSTETLAINITNYILPLVAEDTEDENRPSSTISLLSLVEPFTFGFATFAPGPRLRLVLTAAVERPQ
jgi:hypothetical protein